MDIKISIIVPVYQAQHLVRPCLDNLQKQSYSNYEVILINDGSTDRTREVCEEVKKSNPNIRVIHTENNGAGSARNKGIEAATGSYCLFLDVDDYLEEHLLADCVKVIKEREPEVVFYGFFIHKEGNIKEIRLLYEEGMVPKEQLTSFYLKALETTIAQNIGTKLYKTEIVKRMRFDTQYAICEDSRFSLNIIKNIKSVYYIDKAYYIYHIFQEGSLSKQINLKYYDGHLQFLKELEGYLSSMESEEYKRWFWSYYLDVMKSILYKFCKKKELFFEVYGKIVKDSNIKATKKLIFARDISLIKKTTYSFIWFPNKWLALKFFSRKKE